MKEFLHQYFYLLDKKAKRGLPWLFLLFVASSLLDVIGIGMIGVFLALIANPEAVLSKIPFHSALFPVDMSKNTLVIGAGIFIVTAFVVKAIAGFYIQMKTTRFSFNFGARLKLKLLKAFQFAPFTFHIENNSAYLINKMQNVDLYVRQMVVVSLQVLSNVLIAVFIVALLAVMHPMATLALGILMAAIIWVNQRFLKNTAKAMGELVATANGHMLKNTNHALKGAQEIRVLGREQYFSDEVKTHAEQYAHGYSINAAFQYIPRNLIESSMAIFMVVLCFLSMISGSSITVIISFLGVFAAAGARLMPVMNQLTSGLNQMRFAYKSMESVYQQFQQIAQGEVLSEHCEVKLDFDHFGLDKAFYKYNKATQHALNGITIDIQKAQSVGLMGTSGAGKSTLVAMLLGFLDPQPGQLLVDGKPIQDKRSWLNNFAYIPQQIFLMDDTFGRNVALGIEDNDIDMAKLNKAIAMARLDTVVNELPDGLDTLVGENGIKLSGGQRQRVALARAFYHERDVIVMDEATSSLDNETEAEIIAEIKSLKGLKTLIVIAHRLSTIEHCDVIYKLEKGQVVRSGTFEEVVGTMSPTLSQEVVNES